MDSIIPIGGDTFWLGSNDRETDLFEGLWPLPKGVAYNSYLIRDQKTVLIDTVKGVSAGSFLARLKALLGENRLDYLIVNHLEPDHSGCLGLVLQLFPEVEIVGNKKTAEFLSHLHRINGNVRVVEDGERLSLGGRVLRFHLIPMVHWPETMVTYDERERVLFSCDAFGSFGAHDGGIFDDQVDTDEAEGEMLRYYANIVGKYSVMVQKALAKLQGLEIKTVAPAHGPIWRADPGKVINRYDRWSRFQGEPGVVLAYGSMYGNCRRMMEAIAEGLGAGGLKRILIHDVSRSHPSFILRDAWRYQAVILGAPAYDTRLYSPMANLIDLFDRKQLKNRLAGLFGGYGWSGGGVGTLRDFVGKAGWELIEPVIEARFSPTEENLVDCRRLGENVAGRLVRVEADHSD